MHFPMYFLHLLINGLRFFVIKSSLKQIKYFNMTDLRDYLIQIIINSAHKSAWKVSLQVQKERNRLLFKSGFINNWIWGSI